MIQTTLHSGALQGLRDVLSGQLICTNDDDYDSARKVWNGMIDKYPAAIVRYADVADVITAVEFARSQHLSVAVRSGGHSVSGSSVCNEGIVIDLSCMKGIQVDSMKRTAWVQAGLTLGKFVRGTQTHGLGTTTGTVAGTG